MRCAAILFAIAHLAGVRAEASRDDLLEQAKALAANRYIVEYKTGGLAARDVEASLNSHEDVTVLNAFDNDIFRGASVEVAGGLGADELAALPEVARVWPNAIVTLEGTAPTSFFPDDAAAGTYDVHSATGVQKLHEAGIFGKGVKVGVIDSGVDYTNPALGGGFGPGFKVEGGWDFAGDGLWPAQGGKVPDADPKDQQGHGTHVAGIVAGQSGSWSGVAPNATLYAYKVMARLDYTDVETLIAAMLRAYDDGMDIITISISTPAGGGFASIAWAEVASRMVEQGVLVTIAAGNTGSTGVFSIGDGASGRNVIAVASVDANSSAASPFTLDFHPADGSQQSVVSGYIPATTYFPKTIVDWPVVPLNFNTSDPSDACTPYPAGTRNLTNTIPLVRRGTCTFETKLTNLARLGAFYVLVYNNDNALINPSSDDASQVMGLISADAGKAIIKAVQAGGNVTASFELNPEDPVGIRNPGGGKPSVFDSWGPLYDMTVKPEIAAPGGLIFSTFLGSQFATMSGTSMATPYVAGIAALYVAERGGGSRAARPATFAKDLRQRIITSGVSLAWSDGSLDDLGQTSSVAQTGNGLVNAYKVLRYDTVLESEPLVLKDTKNFQGDQDIVVRNTGNSAVTYTLSTVASGGFEVLNANLAVRNFASLSPLDMKVDVQLSEPFTLQPGESKMVRATFINPSDKGWNATLLPVYSGKIVVSGDNGEQVSVPYLGMAADLQAQMSPIWARGYPFSNSGVQFTSILTKSYYTFNLSQDKQDYMRVYSTIKYGTNELRFDIYEPNWPESQWQYPPAIGVNGYVGSVAEFNGTDFNPRTSNASNVVPLPRLNVRHSSPQIFWMGRLANGTQIRPGNYTMRFAALNPFGDPTRSDAWSIWQAPQIQVLPCPGCPGLGAN